LIAAARGSGYINGIRYSSAADLWGLEGRFGREIENPASIPKVGPAFRILNWKSRLVFRVSDQKHCGYEDGLEPVRLVRHPHGHDRARPMKVRAPHGVLLLSARRRHDCVRTPRPKRLSRPEAQSTILQCNKAAAYCSKLNTLANPNET
jgi:hypothetical protein